MFEGVRYRQIDLVEFVCHIFAQFHDIEQGLTTQLTSGAVNWRHQIDGGRQYNSSEILKYKCNFHLKF